MREKLLVQYCLPLWHDRPGVTLTHGIEAAGKKGNMRALPRSPELMNREDSALLVVDAQEKLLRSCRDGERIVWNIRRLLDAAVARSSVAATEQYPERLSPTVPELKERIGLAPTSCASARACAATFSSVGRTITAIACWCAASKRTCAFCKRRSTLSAAGFDTYVAVDAVGCRYAVDHESALRRMESAGVILTTTENGHVRVVPHGRRAGVQANQCVGEREAACVTACARLRKRIRAAVTHCASHQE